MKSIKTIGNNSSNWKLYFSGKSIIEDWDSPTNVAYLILRKGSSNLLDMRYKCNKDFVKWKK